MLRINHIDVDSKASPSRIDYIKIESINVLSDEVRFNLKISNLSNDLKNFLQSNNNYCYIAPFVRNSSISSRYRLGCSKKAERLKRKYWHRLLNRDSNNNRYDYFSNLYRIRLTNPYGSNTITFTLNKDVFESITSHDHHRIDYVNWNYYFKRFMFRLVMCTSVDNIEDEIGRTGYKSCYSDIDNTDQFIVYYSNYEDEL